MNMNTKIDPCPNQKRVFVKRDQSKINSENEENKSEIGSSSIEDQTKIAEDASSPSQDTVINAQDINKSNGSRKPNEAIERL